MFKSFMQRRRRLSGNVMYWSTPLSISPSTVCSPCCHETTKISGRRMFRPRIAAADRRPARNPAAPRITTESHRAASAVQSSPAASGTTSTFMLPAVPAAAHRRASTRARSSTLSDDITAIRLITSAARMLTGSALPPKNMPNAASSRFFLPAEFAGKIKMPIFAGSKCAPAKTEHAKREQKFIKKCT